MCDVTIIRATLEADGTPVCSECGGLVKPNIVFFGEPLPERFFSSAAEDMPECDLLIVLGTSLKVWHSSPFLRSTLRRLPAKCAASKSSRW
jgi:NAD-dependent SIR2 family protein deacetylase